MHFALVTMSSSTRMEFEIGDPELLYRFPMSVFDTLTPARE